MINLDRRTALVTGGSRGIGRACCEMLAQAGAAVAVHYGTRREEAAAVVDGISRGGGRALMVRADVADQKEVDQAVATIASDLGPPDILVNNAGIWEGGAVEDLTAADWDRTMNVNTRSMFLFARRIVPIMKKTGGGRIVNIASTAGQRGEAFHSHYAASKGAVIALTRSLATELAGAGIRVNCVAPGWVDTDMCTGAFAHGGRAGIEQGIPLGRVGRPEEIAGAVLFAVSDLSTFMTGAVVSVNGGAIMA